MQSLLSYSSQEFLSKPLWMWVIFLSIVLVLIALDLGVFNRKDKEIDIKTSLRMYACYFSIGLGFGGWIWWYLGQAAAFTYWTGFVVEQTLSMDNIFVMSMIFTYFSIPRQYQHRVLFYGILGVIVLRGTMIALGTVIVSQFQWVLYLFALFLIFTGLKMLVKQGGETDISKKPILRYLSKTSWVTSKIHGHSFFVRENNPKTGKLELYITPLFVALIMIEIADVIFAVDSIPAIFSITTDPYLIYTSNIFAILGLRSLYFALAAMLSYFVYLQFTLAIILMFIGSKIFITEVFELVKFPPIISFLVTVGILLVGIILSIVKGKKK